MLLLWEDSQFLSSVTSHLTIIMTGHRCLPLLQLGRLPLLEAQSLFFTLRRGPRPQPHPITLLASEKGNYATNHTDTLPETPEEHLLLHSTPLPHPAPTGLSRTPMPPFQPHGELKLFCTRSHPSSKHAPSSCLHPFQHRKTLRELLDPRGRAVNGPGSGNSKTAFQENCDQKGQNWGWKAKNVASPSIRIKPMFGAWGSLLFFPLTPPIPVSLGLQPEPIFLNITHPFPEKPTSQNRPLIR